MLNRKQHEIHLRSILNSIFDHKILSTQLAFKGGTCLYLFYGLDRFSTDLDLNCLSKELDVKLMDSILENYAVEETNFSDKRFTWFWLISYIKGHMNIKIEVSKRNYPDTYELKDLLGVKVKCMTKDCMFAHKLCAITDRKKLANRDLYDALFMFQKSFPINEEIIKLRTGKNLSEYLGYLIEFIDKNLNSKNILNGLGEVLNEAQKDRVKIKLKPDLLFTLKNYKASFDN